MGSLASEGAEIFGVDASGFFVGFDHDCEEECDYDRFHDYVGEHEGLHDGIHSELAGGDVGEDWGGATDAISDAEEEHVCGGLEDGEADDGVDEVAAGDEAIEAAEEEPGGDDVGEHGEVWGHGGPL
jgi:hypothetical protein